MPTTDFYNAINTFYTSYVTFQIAFFYSVIKFVFSYFVSKKFRFLQLDFSKVLPIWATTSIRVSSVYTRFKFLIAFHYQCFRYSIFYPTVHISFLYKPRTAHLQTFWKTYRNKKIYLPFLCFICLELITTSLFSSAISRLH